MDFAEEAARHRYQAEELRAKAGLMSDAETRALYIRMADAYEAMARNEDRVKRASD
ncbi:hypothetical protein JQ633_28810 [Bradyrhizobium tropiciagri]|uniref:hypothetical protein n=1 Tax=Bradyrhizobium tropiciagri TaxID=312253 RepID=UPI001BA579C9|nr:hypothetical protein [Bradyrhizobium tropiciagri]MBR0874388.1 hypothetical protein [Bradyrhizobium tropiciagri]